MNKTTHILVILLVGALALIACQASAPPSGGGAPAPTQPSSSESDSEPTPTQPSGISAGGEKPLELSDVSEGLSSLDSYRATFTMSFDGKDAEGQPEQSAWSFVEEYSKNPPAKRTRFTTSETGDASAVGSFETIEVDGKTYSIFGDVCASAGAEEAPTADTTFSPSNVIGDIESSQFVGAETVNGVSAKHYVVDSSDILALGAYTQAKAETWVADPGGFVVKYTFEATGKGTLLFGTSDAEGTLRWDYEVTSVNQPVDITAPENCGGAPPDVPLMPDATDTSSFGELTSYTSASAFADVVAFYKEQMPANGWAEDTSGAFTAENFTTLTFTQDGRTASISITFDTSTNRTTVLISLSGE